MPVQSEHELYKARKKDYQLITDCIAGERAIKKAGTRYLPQPNPEDESPENTARYEAYKKRAVFSNFTARTVGNYVGQSFAVDPVATVPEVMKSILDDLDGEGKNAVQHSKKALSYVVAYSRAFLWVDYPKTEGTVSIEDAEKNGIRPRIVLVHPEDVINWRVTRVGAKTKLSLVVIRETYYEDSDGFEMLPRVQYRVLKLVDNVYQIELHKAEGGTSTIKLEETVIPQDGAGQTFNEIPCCFIGAESNDIDPEKPLMLDIANLNVAHYRNSADYEEAAYMLGQPTPYVTGLTDQWAERWFSKGIHLGSRTILPLPASATAGLIQAEANSLPKEAMDQKETLIQALGAKLVEKREVQKTATEAGIDEASETSILASCCHNVSVAYGIALRFAAQYANVQVANPAEDILFELNTDFAIARMTAEEAQGVLTIYQGQLITFEEARDKLKTGGWAYLDDEDAKEQLDEKEEEEFSKTQREMKSQLDIQKKAGALPKAGKIPPAQ